MARLSRYTSFSPKGFPLPMPLRLNKVLAHWNPSEDPVTYDWRSTSRRFAQFDDDQGEDDEITEKERLRLRQRKERHLRRERREAEESQLQEVLSSQAPAIVSAASQPTPRAQSQHEAVESQDTGASQGQVPASQVLPGRHGGRPPPRKKRKSGF